MANRKNTTFNLTRHELRHELEYLTKDLSELRSYVERLEGVIRLYKREDRNEVLSALLKENLAYKTRLAEMGEKIDHLVKDVIDANSEIADLEKKLNSALVTISQYETVSASLEGEIKQIKN